MRRDLKPKTLLGVLALAIGLVFGVGVADAQEEVDTYEETPPVVVDDVDETPEQVASETQAPEVAGDQVVRGTATLPVTGGDLIAMAILGLGAIGAGSAVLLYRRRAVS